jgi:hypothetical protein
VISLLKIQLKGDHQSTNEKYVKKPEESNPIKFKKKTDAELVRNGLKIRL